MCSWQRPGEVSTRLSFQSDITILQQMAMAHLAREARTGCAASQSSRLVLSDDSELERSNNLIANSQQVCRSRSSWYLHQISRMIRVGQAGGGGVALVSWGLSPHPDARAIGFHTKNLKKIDTKTKKGPQMASYVLCHS